MGPLENGFTVLKVLIFFSLFQRSFSSSAIDPKRVTAWEDEIEKSLVRNIKGGCPWYYTDNMNQSYLAQGDDRFMIRRVYPSKSELIALKQLPESLTKSHLGLEINAKLRGYSYEKWGVQTESRWEIPANHPGQNRNNCLAMTFLAAKGKPVSFYTEFRDVDRAFYLAYIQRALVHPSGAVGAACGYYMGEECCENRWDYARDWYNDCKRTIKSLKLTWAALWNQNLPERTKEALIEGCTSHKDLGLPFDGKVAKHAPKIVSKVFVMPSLWDYNYHHFVADSLARMVHSLRYLRRNPDVYIHFRTFERYDGMHFRDEQFRKNSESMRNRFVDLLGIDRSRVVSDMVLAEQVIIPRCTRCSYAVSNPVEIRLLRKLLVQFSIMELKSKKPELLTQSFSDSSSVSSSSIYRVQPVQASKQESNPTQRTSGSKARSINSKKRIFSGTGKHRTLTESLHENPSQSSNVSLNAGTTYERKLFTEAEMYQELSLLQQQQELIKTLTQYPNVQISPEAVRRSIVPSTSSSGSIAGKVGGEYFGQKGSLTSSSSSNVIDKKLTMIVQQRYSAFNSDDRNWNDETLSRVVSSLTKYFPNHNIVVLSSKATKSPDYCLACDIMLYTRADILVGAHGAGLTNVMFLPPHALLIEIAGEIKDVNMPVCGYYGPMASMFGVHHYIYVHGEGNQVKIPPMPFETDVMAKEAAEFYKYLRNPSVDKTKVIRITNSTSGPVGCRP